LLGRTFLFLANECGSQVVPGVHLKVAVQEAKPQVDPVSTIVMGDGDVEDTTARLQRIPRTTMTMQLPAELLKITGTQRRVLDSTVELGAGAAAAAKGQDALPFQSANAPDKPTSPSRPASPIPGSPWANEAAPRPPSSSPRYDQTLDILELEEVDEDAQPAKGASNVPAPAPAPVPVPVPVPVSAPAPEPPAPPPPPRIPPPSPSRPAIPALKGDLYKKFNKKK